MRLTKSARLVIASAERVGVRFLDIVEDARHAVLRFINDEGVVMRQPISMGSKISPQDIANNRAQFKRFARGQYHGLRVERQGN